METISALAWVVGPVVVAMMLALWSLLRTFEHDGELPPETALDAWRTMLEPMRIELAEMRQENMEMRTLLSQKTDAIAIQDARLRTQEIRIRTLEDRYDAVTKVMVSFARQLRDAGIKPDPDYFHRHAIVDTELREVMAEYGLTPKDME